LQVAGTSYPSGIGILANSRMEVRNEGFRRFEATVGIDDSATEKGRAVTFSVYGDGKLLGKSRPLTWGARAQPLAFNVAGVKLIELVARAAGTDNERLPVTWGMAALKH